MKRALLAGAFVAGGLVAFFIFRSACWHWVEVHTGTVNESGPYYGFFSGFGSDIGELALVGGLVTLVRSRNCNHKGCWRYGVHTTKNGHKLCKTHISMPNAELEVHPIHDDHL